MAAIETGPRIARQQLKILAWGDSLTAGYFAGGSHPYSIELKCLIEAKYPNVNLTMDQQGLSGERTLEMSLRLKEYLKSSAKFDFVLILGGTNDI